MYSKRVYQIIPGIFYFQGLFVLFVLVELENPHHVVNVLEAVYDPTEVCQHIFIRAN